MNASLGTQLLGLKPWMRWLLVGSAALSAIILLLPGSDESGAVVQPRLPGEAAQASPFVNPELTASPLPASEALPRPANG